MLTRCGGKVGVWEQTREEAPTARALAQVGSSYPEGMTVKGCSQGVLWRLLPLEESTVQHLVGGLGPGWQGQESDK